MSFTNLFWNHLGFPGGSDCKASARNVGDLRFHPWVGKNPWRRKRQSTPVFLPRRSHGQRTLVGYSLWCHEEPGKTKRLHFLSFWNLLLLLNRFSRLRLSATPQTAAHQAPPSLGFSRQEHWSGLPFPSPVHESEKWKWSRSVVSDSQWLHGLQPTRLLGPWDFSGKSTGVGCHCLLHEII